jgi:hypothetical protein
MAKPKKSAPPKRSWRDLDDRHHRSFPTQPSPESLHPDATTVLNAVCGNAEARAIADSYAFRFPVTTLNLQGVCA